MEIPLRVLIIEDSEDDTLLLVRLLQKNGYDPKYERVETADAMLEALERQAWDVIISDYTMPRFSGLSALTLYKEKGLDIPFIIVSGAIGEETAAEVMVSGAHDYVMKNNLPRLIPAIQRELREAESRRERERAREQLRFQAQIIENSPVIAAYHDKDLNMVWANRAYQKATGLNLEQIRGRKCYQVWNLSKPCRGCPVITAIETGERAAHELTPDNQDHWPEIQGYWLSEAAPVRDEQGVVTGAIEFAIDITQRRRAEEALKLSEVKYRSIFENVVEGIFQTTPDGRFLVVNPSLARICGYGSPEEMIETITDISRQVYVNPDERDGLLRIIQEKGIATGLELQMRRKDGSTFWASANARTVYDKDGKFLYYEGTIEDITERKMVQDALRRKVDELERFSSLTVGRELRIIELKKEINSLLKKAGEPEKYRIAE